MRSVSTPLPSVNTATALPASGVSVKTSAMTYRRSMVQLYAGRRGRLPVRAFLLRCDALRRLRSAPLAGTDEPGSEDQEHEPACQGGFSAPALDEALASPAGRSLGRLLRTAAVRVSDEL